MTVYVVGHSPRTGPVKIGYARDVEDRLRALRRGETCPLAVHQRFSSTRPPSDLALLHSIEGDRQLERALHHRLREFRIEGEWFSLGSSPDQVVEAVEQAANLSRLSGDEWRSLVAAPKASRRSRRIITALPVDLPGVEWTEYVESRKAPIVHAQLASLSESEIRASEREILADLIEVRYESAANADQREALRGILEVLRPATWRSGRR